MGLRRPKDDGHMDRIQGPVGLEIAPRHRIHDRARRTPGACDVCDHRAHVVERLLEHHAVSATTLVTILPDFASLITASNPQDAAPHG